MPTSPSGRFAQVVNVTLIKRMIMVSAHHVSYRKKGKGHVQQGAKAGDGNTEFYINRTFVNMLLGFVYEEDDPENLSKLLEMARKKALFMYPGCSTDSKAAHQDGNAKVVARLVTRAVEQDVRADIKWPSAAKNQTVCSKMSDFHASFMWAWGKYMQSRRNLHSRPHLKQTRTCKRQCTFKKKICYGSCQNSSHA